MTVVRKSYLHRDGCEKVTVMKQALAEDFAKEPARFGGLLYCCTCRAYRPFTEFCWLDGTVVGS